MTASSNETIDRVFGSVVGRRAALALGARTVAGLTAALGAGAALSLFSSLAGCYRAPGTGRDQLIFFSEEKEMQFGIEAYREVLRESRLSENPETTEMVQRVGQRIAQAANKPAYQWEFAVIEEDKMINAFCLPGGKVAVFTGILKVTKGEAGLATVMGHEVAHALQRQDRKSTRLNSSHVSESRMPSSA